MEDGAQFQTEPISEKQVQTAKIECQTSGGKFFF